METERQVQSGLAAGSGQPWYRCLSGNALKMIAIVTMMIDHVGAALLESGLVRSYNAGQLAISYNEALRWWNFEQILRDIGRVAFPIYCFLLVEGFLHTRDVKKYALRLGIFALLSEIPFDLAFEHSLLYIHSQNVFFTLLLGLLAMMGVRCFEENWQYRWLGLAAAVLCCFLGDALYTDYGTFGVFFIVMLYAFRNCGWLQAAVGAVLIAWEKTAPLAFIPILMYNGTRGKWKLKILFYAIYPIHLLVLYGIWRMIF